MPPGNTRLVGHRIDDPRVPFHWWIDINGQALEAARDISDIVIPDGVPNGVTLLVHRLEIVCVSGWYEVGTFGLPGLPSLIQGVRDIITDMVMARSKMALLGAWDFGSPMAGMPLERFIRELRGETQGNSPENRHLIGGAPADCAALRALLQRATGAHYSVTNQGAWSSIDQLTLLRFQAQHELPTTGWPDLITVGMMRQVIAQRTHERTSNPSLVASPHFSLASSEARTG